MQCPKCAYEPTMQEQQESPGKCPSCEVYYHKVARPAIAEVKIETGVGFLSSWRAKAAVTVFVVIAAVASGYFGYLKYQRNLLVDRVEESMRMSNSYVAEILDDQARLTNAEYLAKVPRRIAELDSLVAATLAIDDSLIPGISVAAAGYAKSSRSFLNRFTDHLRMTLNLSMLEAGHKVYAAYPETQEGREYLSKTDTQIEAENQLSLSEVQSAVDLGEKVRLISAAAARANNQKKRQSYLTSLGEVNAARDRLENAARELAAAGRRLQVDGDTVSRLAGRPMPTRAWSMPSM